MCDPYELRWMPHPARVRLLTTDDEWRFTIGIAWVGYDTPRQLGVRGETGGSLSLPIWSGYMQTALKGVPVAEVSEPAGLVHVDGETYFDDYGPGRGVASLGLDNLPTPAAETLAAAPVSPMPQAEERNRILEWFR